MANKIYTCPTGDAAFGDISITLAGCAPTPGMAARFAFGCVNGAQGFTGSSTTDIKTSAQWVAAMAKTDEDKVVLAPLHENLDWPVTEPLSRDMTNAKRLKAYRKGNAITVKGMWPMLSMSDYTDLDALSGFSSPFAVNTNLMVYILTENNMIWHDANYKGVPIWNFIVSDPTPTTDDVVMIPFQFDIEYGWARGMTLSQATFNVLTLTT